VGPGSYNGDVKFYKPMAPFFARQGLRNERRKHTTQTGSIKGDFYEESEEEGSRENSPGPGAYQTEDSAFKTRNRPNSLQLFGSSVKRFVDSQIDSGLGPGQYRARNQIGTKFNSVLRVAGSATFKSPKRHDMANSLSFDMPGPGDYTGEQVRQTIAKRIKEKKINAISTMQFAVKAKRFDKDETISPGPAAYKLPDSCQVRNPQIKLASYSSGTERDLNFIVGKLNPGVGAYNTGEQKAIGTSVGKGGGAPSNFTTGLPHLNASIRHVQSVVQPRLPNVEQRSKS